MSSSVDNESRTPSRPARRVGPWLLWFAVLGGSLAWALHLFVGWAVLELACLRGHSTVLGLPLRGFAALATGLPLLLAVAATGLAWRLRRRCGPSGGEEQQDRALGRARFMADVGLALNLFAVAAIVAVGAALLVLEPCAT
ncbi:MAG TPA: hypothetical protein VHH34_07160 [Pseudonocardiaceae bacterium]|nr:hypothetical protein [Pseudonocardiaceae bacterium]